MRRNPWCSLHHSSQSIAAIGYDTVGRRFKINSTMGKSIELSYKSLYRYIKNLLGSGGVYHKKTSTTPKRKRAFWQKYRPPLFSMMNKNVAKTFASPRGYRIFKPSKRNPTPQ